MQKEFKLGAILTITTGHLVAENHMDDVYDIVHHVMDTDEISTIGLVAFNGFYTDAVKEQFPHLPTEYDGGAGEDNAMEWVENAKKIYGDSFMVSQIKDKEECEEEE